MQNCLKRLFLEITAIFSHFKFMKKTLYLKLMFIIFIRSVNLRITAIILHLTKYLFNIIDEGEKSWIFSSTKLKFKH